VSILKLPLVSKIRRYHALEHATIRILNHRHPTAQLAGLSVPNGFFVYGDVPTIEIRSALAEALSRLAAGERHLAIHPHCGTNLVTAGTLAGIVAFLSMLPGDERDRRTRLPLVLLLSTLAMLLAQPLGLVVQQRVTTEADPGDISVVRIEKGLVRETPVHRVQLRDGSSDS
jgi:hypothetical protein